MRAALVVLAALATALPAAATYVEVGASGQCYDAAGQGGEDEARVALDPASTPPPAVVLPSGTGAAAALAQAATFYTGGSGCSDAPLRRSPDYAEAHGRVDGTLVQACYDDRATGPLPDPANVGLRAVHVDGSCPTSPAPQGP